MQITLRMATLSDLENLLRLQSKTITEEKLAPQDYLPISEDELRILISKNGGVCCAETGNILCGFVCYQYSSELDIKMSPRASKALEDAVFLRVRNAIVDSEYRHNKLTIKMLSYIERKVEPLSRNIIIMVAPNNIRSILILFSQDFFIIGFTEFESAFRLVMCKSKNIILNQQYAVTIPIDNEVKNQIKTNLLFGLVGAKLCEIDTLWHIVFHSFE